MAILIKVVVVVAIVMIVAVVVIRRVGRTKDRTTHSVMEMEDTYIDRITRDGRIYKTLPSPL